jgi:hypothetical protein
MTNPIPAAAYRQEGEAGTPGGGPNPNCDRACCPE